MEQKLEVIAKIYTEFPEKFGIPRQSGLVSGLRGRIVFEPKFRNPDAVRGIEEFSHLWLIWKFHKAKQDVFHATVAPPRLGGKEKKGVFATTLKNLCLIFCSPPYTSSPMPASTNAFLSGAPGIATSVYSNTFIA